MATKDEIIASFPTRLRELLPEMQILSLERSESRDYDLLLGVQIGQVQRKLVCQVKSVGEPRYLHQAISALKLSSVMDESVYPVVIAPYISEQGRHLCREASIGFIDLTGNIFLQFDSVFVDKSGSEPPPRERRQLRRLFSPVSSRVIRALLENPGRTWTLTALSAGSKASLRLTYQVVSALAEKDYVDKKRAAIALIRPGELLELWAHNYDFRINTIQTFYSFDRTFDLFARKLDALAERESLIYAFTLHSGASLIAPFVRFADVHFYYQGDVEVLIQGLDLRPVESGGSVHILKPYDEGVFYNLQRPAGLPVVCNTQLYLDLINYPARGREQAQFLREQKMPF